MRQQNSRERARPLGALRPSLIALAGVAAGYGMAAPAAAQPCDPAELFGPSMQYPIAPDDSPADRPFDMVAADFDGDGNVDLATPALRNLFAGNLVAVTLNNGDGTFAPPQQYEVGPQSENPLPGPLAAADFDGDGDIDLATVNLFTADVSVLLNNGDGTFAPPQRFGSLPDPRFAIAAADLDGDGDTDLASASGSSVTVLYNDGSGAFDTQQEFSNLGSGNLSLTAADLDGDGDIDLATANNSEQGKAVTVFFNEGDGLFSDELFFTPSGEPPPSAVNAADLDGDGDTDLAVSLVMNSSDDGLVAVLLNDGSGDFELGPLLPTDGSTRNPLMPDVDGDGDLDIVVSNAASDIVSVFLNNGDATFAPEQTFLVEAGKPPFGANPFDMVAADLDGKGGPDLATANTSSGNLSVLLNTCLGGDDCPPDLNGDGEVTSSDFLEYIDLFAAGDPAADFNDDGSITSNDFLDYIDAFAKGCP